jgi:Arc/MetJ-type ribon-helix-helix transcriptional regulator
MISKDVKIVKLISFKAPSAFLEELDELVRSGVYSSRSEAIRTAIRDLLKRELEWREGDQPSSLK